MRRTIGPEGKFQDVCFYAQSRTQVAVAADTYTQMTYETVGVNEGGCTIDAAGTIRIPIDGCYVISQQTSIGVSTADLKTAFCMANTTPADLAAVQTQRFAAAASTDLQAGLLNGSAAMFLQAGDLIRVWVLSETVGETTPVETNQRFANSISLVRTA